MGGGSGYVGMKRSSKTAPRDGATRGQEQSRGRVLGRVLEELTGILRAINCLASVKLGALRVKGKKEQGSEKGGERRKRKGKGKEKGNRPEHSGETVGRLGG